VVPNSSDDAKYASEPTDFQVDNAPGDNDVRHRIVLSGVWNLDYAGGIQNPILRVLASGWTLSGIISFQTGMPYSLEINGDLNNDGNTRNDLNRWCCATRGTLNERLVEPPRPGGIARGTTRRPSEGLRERFPRPPLERNRCKGKL